MAIDMCSSMALSLVNDNNGNMERLGNSMWHCILIMENIERCDSMAMSLVNGNRDVQQHDIESCQWQVWKTW